MTNTISFFTRPRPETVVPVDFSSDDGRPWFVQMGKHGAKRGKTRRFRTRRKRVHDRDQLSAESFVC